MIFGIGLPSRVSPSGTRKKPTCKPCSPYSRPILVTPATPIPPIISPAQRSYWAWQPIAQPAAEVPHERAFFPSALLESFFRSRLVKQRNASSRRLPATATPCAC